MDTNTTHTHRAAAWRTGTEPGADEAPSLAGAVAAAEAAGWRCTAATRHPATDSEAGWVDLWLALDGDDAAAADRGPIGIATEADGHAIEIETAPAR